MVRLVVSGVSGVSGVNGVSDINSICCCITCGISSSVVDMICYLIISILLSYENIIKRP